jgi:DNA-binding GntR family transcriptional regulator
MCETNESTADRTQSTRDSALVQLRNWIVNGILEPGQIIKEREVANRLGVSRTPVREALLILKGEGLVISEPQGWTQVKPLDVRQLEKLYPVLVDLEVLAARMAAGNAPADLSALESAQHAFVAVLDEASDPPGPESALELMQADDRFHSEVIRLADNVFVLEALLPLKTLMRRYEVLYYGGTTTISRRSVDIHERWIEAIRRGDSELAAESARSNWENFRWRPPVALR